MPLVGCDGENSNPIAERDAKLQLFFYIRKRAREKMQKKKILFAHMIFFLYFCNRKSCAEDKLTKTYIDL